MEGGDPEESDGDVQGSTVLWERCIQQSIFVDLSEDESLHFSDLEASLDMHLSQAESPASGASIHLSGSALSALDSTSSESSVESSPSERVVEDKTKSSILHESVQRPNTVQDELPLKQGNEDPGLDTSDEDQEDLPYDGDLGSPYFNKAASTEGDSSSDGSRTIGGSPDGPCLLEFTTADGDETSERLVSGSEEPGTLSQEDEGAKQENCVDAFQPSDVAPPCPSPTDINQLLLRHFTQEELLRPGRLIDAETLPEVSLLESMSWAPTCNSTATNNNHTEIPAWDSEIFSDRTDEKSHTASQNSSLENEAERSIDKSSRDSNQSSGDNTATQAVVQEKSEEDDQFQRVPLVRTRSFCEIKYGQGQVHYPLPDFSKVAPKVKIPKAPSGPSRPAPPTPGTMHRAQSSPGMLDLISRVLEDSVPQPEKAYVFKDEAKQYPSGLAHHLQAEYDKLLTRSAEAENLIDQMRLGANPSTDLMLYSECDDDHQRNLAEGSHLGSLAPHLHPSENFGQRRGTVPQSYTAEVIAASLSQPEEGLSDGERMTAELREVISPFMQKVEELKTIVSNMSISIAEQQMMLRSMMEAQDQLERKYMSTRDEHRALEMQNYMGLSRNTGTFDPDRLVEGDIFRIGMHLDDIKEMIDKNLCEQMSPPHSSSTPMPMTDKLHVRPGSVCMLTPSPPPSLHEGPCAGFSTVTFEMEPRTEEEEAEEVEERNSEESDGLEQSSELITADSALKHTGYNNCQSRSLERLDVQRDDKEEGDEEERSSVLSEGIVHGNISAHLSRTSSTSRQTEWTPERRCTPDSVLIPEGECDLGDGVSLAVEVSSSSHAPKLSDTHGLSEPPLNSPCASQRLVSPETDSGFGSSYLNLSASGSFQPNLLIESVPSHNDGLSSSDGEGSCSNLQTTIHPAALNIQQWSGSNPSLQTQFCVAAAAVDLWVESTTTDPVVRLQGSDPGLPALLGHCVSEPVLSTTMDSEDRGSPVNSCSCNSEAILALQSEVSRLKKDLEEGLVQLPHLAQKMDYLTSKYRHGRQERRSKTRARTHLRQSCNSPTRIEDWISSDMDPSKSKGTDIGDTAGSDIMLQFHSSSAGSRRGSGVRSGPEFQYKLQEALQSSRGTEGNYSVKTSGLTSSILKGGASDRSANHSPQSDVMESFYSRRRWSPLSSLALQKPLLQVSYGSSSSLPASYKLREPPQSTSHHRKRSTQSDSALLPSNVFFQRTLSPGAAPSKTVSRTGTRRGSKEEMNRTLDQAIEVARSMKRTTDRMAKRLSADLGKAQLNKKLHNTQPLGGRKHHAF
ncbi:microtubule organization protein AKNA isoform X2 [Hippoglossus stenolepis]|uniref:microtubule organization protein AKNA isoform X2 n=1 Tax=Hippoglossus stenolepis TaxID=195615 RepID=UPI001FAFA6F6|nr:microtubule organization protein AKNA isoform X2 [Hippoglossus stenolepis]